MLPAHTGRGYASCVSGEATQGVPARPAIASEGGASGCGALLEMCLSCQNNLDAADLGGGCCSNISGSFSWKIMKLSTLPRGKPFY